MHELHARSYVGQTGEAVTVNVTASGGGQTQVTVDGQVLAGSQFSLSNNAGASHRLQVALVGPQGASCVVGIAVVDGGAAADLLLCTAFNPAPVGFYDFSVAPAAAIETFGAARTRGAAAGGTK